MDLAELFVSKALSLLPHTSHVIQAWKERMQVCLFADDFVVIRNQYFMHNMRRFLLIPYSNEPIPDALLLLYNCRTHTWPFSRKKKRRKD
jgi:hypothetical protein